jgi:hypothetical protein
MRRGIECPDKADSVMSDYIKLSTNAARDKIRKNEKYNTLSPLIPLIPRSGTLIQNGLTLAS